MLEDAMSSSPEYNSAEVFSKSEEAPDKEQPSQTNLEQDSEEDSELEHSFFNSVVTKNFYTCFPTPHNIWKPYFLKRNFRGPEDALHYINEKFHIDKIHNNHQVYPNFASDYIYQYTYIDDHLYIALQCKVQHIIDERNAQIDQYALHLHYSIAGIHPYLLQCIF